MPRWPLRNTPFWAEAPLFHLLLPLLLAAVAYDRGWLRPSPAWPLTALGCAGLLMLLVIAGHGRRPQMKPLFFAAVYGAVFCFGLGRAQHLDIRNNLNWFGSRGATAEGSLVQVVDEPQEKERIWRMHVRIVQSLSAAPRAATGEAFLNVYKGAAAPGYHAGDLLLVPAQWQELTNSGNPFEIDYRTANRRRNICHQQFLGPDRVQLFRKAAGRPSGVLERIHRYCDAQLNRYVTDPGTHGLLEAMLLGDESTFDPDLRQAYSETGVVHIVSISGSHVGVLFAAVALLLSGIRGRAGPWIRLLLGLALIWCYVLMAGAPPSAIRAALMFSIIGAGTVLAREAHPLNTLFAAAVALLCANPMWLCSVGFQLSFAAVLSLILFYRPIRSLWPQSNKAFRILWNGVAASLAAEVLTAPLVIYYFHNFPLFFMIANLLAAFLVGLLALLGGMLIIAFSPIPALAGAVAWGVTQAVKAFNAVILLLQSWNPPSLRYLQINGPELVLLYLMIAGCSVWLLKKARPGLYIGLTAMVALLTCLCMDRIAAVRQDRLVVYNVSRHFVAERIRGSHYQSRVRDTAKAVLLTTKQAHTGWAAWKPAARTLPECFSLQGRTILVLNTALRQDTTARFPVDVLVVQYPLKALEPRLLQQTFRPKVIVAGSDQPRWVVRKWQDACIQLRIPFHATGTAGAFMLE